MSKEFDRMSKVRPLMQSLYRFSKKNLAFQPDASIAILKDNINADNPLGKTAYYDPATHKISLYTQGRHVKDVMRSLSHELVHHAQNCRGDFEGGIATVDGYAQEDGHLREMEREAYETGNLIFRDWEDGLKAETNNGGLFNSRPLGEKLMENRISEIADKTLVDEIVLTMTSDRDFYRQTIQPWIKNFRRKIKKGVFDDGEALLAFERYAVKDALKKYSIDQAGDPNFWKQISREDQRAIAKELLNYYMEEIQDLEEQKTMGNQETELREIIRGLVQEMLVSVKEDSGACSEDNPGPCETSEADTEKAQAASAAALGGAEEHGGGDETDKPYQTQAEAKDPGGGDLADVEEAEEDDEFEKGKKDKQYESFFPVAHDIRSKARMDMNETLMKRWGYLKKK